jgi:hypothetical protein
MAAARGAAAKLARCRWQRSMLRPVELDTRASGLPCSGGFAARIYSTPASTTLLCPPRPGARRLPRLLCRARQGPFFSLEGPFPARLGNAEMAGAVPPLLPSSPSTPTSCSSDARGLLSPFLSWRGATTMMQGGVAAGA